MSPSVNSPFNFTSEINSVFLSQYHPTNTVYKLIRQSPTLYRLILVAEGILK